MKTLEVHTTLIEERVVEVPGAGHGIAGSVYIYTVYIYILYIYIYYTHIYIYIYISVVDKKEGTWIRKVYGLSMFLNLIYSMCIYI